MAEAARSVKHYVSDCLAERHPYDVERGFAGRPRRDAGKAFDGHLPAGGIDNLLGTLMDGTVSNEECARAVRYLYSHSASQEMKIELIQKGVVPIIVSLLNKRPSNILSHQCFLLLWSLSVLPQGCYPVVQCGGVEVALRVVLDEDGEGEGEDCGGGRTQVRVAAASVMAQVASNVAGLRWMLQAEHCDEFVLAGVEYPSTGSGFADGSVTPSPEELLDGLARAIHKEPLGESKVALHCATALSHLTSIAHGIHLITAAHDNASQDTPEEEPSSTGLIGTLVDQLELYAHELARLVEANEEASVAMTPSLAYLVQLLTITWNVSMDQTGVELLDKSGAPDKLFSLFAVVQAVGVSRCPTLLQRALVGALSAVSKLTSVKLAYPSLLEGPPLLKVSEQVSRVQGLLRYLQQINHLVQEASVSGKEPRSDVVAMSKNTVQCLRLASEVKAVRDITHAFLSALDDVEGSTEGFYFRRQLYCSTKWEEEYKASL